MNILVTGSEGSLMQWTIPLLSEQGHRIRGVDNFARYGESERHREYELVRGDLTDASFCEDVMQGMDGVIQAAATIYGVGGFHKYPADILARDVTLHQNLLWAMHKMGIEQISYISSSMVYERCRFHPSKEENADESPAPATEYGLSKLVGERLTRAFSKQYGIKFCVWRPFNIITPYEKAGKEQGDSHVFSDFIKGIVVDKMRILPIIGDGEQIRCFTWIGDVAEGIARHSFTKPAENHTFNLGNPRPTSMKELAFLIHRTAQELKLISKTDGQMRFESRKSFSDDVRIRIPDISKAEKILGWKPSVSVEESVRRCLILLR